MLKQIIQSVLREDTTEQLDSAFEGITRAISLRCAQGLGTDEGLNEMLASITAERNTRPPVAEP
jgi:transcriptional regulatory protein LevR